MIRTSRVFRIIAMPLLMISVLIGLKLSAGRQRFDADAAIMDNVAGHIAELTSPEYDGRIAGSAANERAMDYVASQFESLGLEPASDDGTWYQRFPALIPDIDGNAVFTVANAAGRVIHDFTLYEDFRVVPSGYGAGIDFTGEIVLVGQNLVNVDPSVLDGRIVVIESIITNEAKITLALESGARGVFLVSQRDWSGSAIFPDEIAKDISTEGKRGARLLVGNLHRLAYRELMNLVGREGLFDRERPYAVVPGVTVKVGIRFPIVDTMNVLAKLEGRGRGDRVLLISAAADGLGPGSEGKYFPGAVNSAAGVATLLEIARVMAEHDTRPADTVIFAVWNAQENQFAGSGFYASHPPVPLERTTVIHLDALGGTGDPFITLASGAANGRILRSRMARFAADSGIAAAERVVSAQAALTPFVSRDVPGVMISAGEPVINYYPDNADGVNIAAVERAARAVLSYLKRDAYRDFAAEYLTPGNRVVIWMFITLALTSSLITSTHKHLPELKAGRLSIEQLYYHPAADIVRRALAIVIPAGAALFLFVLLVNLPPNGTIETVNGKTVSNYSVYLSVKEAVLFLRQMFRGQTGTISDRGTLLEVTLSSGFRSLRLIAGSLALSLVLGVGRGVLENYRGRKTGSVRSVGTLFLASLPDVAVVLGGLWLYVFISQRFPGLREIVNLKDFLLPLVALSILPTAYMSRISSIAIREELSREYVRHARGKGYSKAALYRHELLPAAISAVLDSVPSLTTVILTNLIVVEYLFDYKGIIYYLLYFYKRQDGASFIIMSISVAALYLLFSGLARLAAHLSNPMKRKRFV